MTVHLQSGILLQGQGSSQTDCGRTTDNRRDLLYIYFNIRILHSVSAGVQVLGEETFRRTKGGRLILKVSIQVPVGDVRCLDTDGRPTTDRWSPATTLPT